MLQDKDDRPGHLRRRRSPRRCGWPPTARRPGPATVVYPIETQESSDPYFTDYVFQWLEAHLPGGRDQIYQDGLKIETTLDPAQQAIARDQVSHFLNGTAPDLRASLVAVEPPTGYVRAFISGRYDFATDQVNYALGK